MHEQLQPSVSNGLERVPIQGIIPRQMTRCGWFNAAQAPDQCFGIADSNVDRISCVAWNPPRYSNLIPLDVRGKHMG